ncbi:MAG: ATP-binding protein [Patescibacteria group bacterium]
MTTSAHLIIHNIGFLVNAALLVFLIILVFIKGRKEKGRTLFILGFTSILIWVVSHVIGVNIADPQLSRFVLMFHISILFISCFIAHFIFVFLGKEKQQRIPIIIFYSLSVFLALIYIAFPDTLITDSIPKLYFPNYYVAGSLHWAMNLLSNVIIPAYFLIYMALQYPSQSDVMKNRIKYLFFGFLFGYSLGGMGIPLVFTSEPIFFGITIDPLYSIIFVPLFSIPFTYAVFKYELIDIRIIAKRALRYALTVAIVGICIGLLVFSDDIIRLRIPTFPLWIIPLVSSVIAVSVSFFMWNKLRQTDELKSNFISVVTHKFRTPLTQIRWASEGFTAEIGAEDRERVQQIQQANIRLIELTDLLAHVSDADITDFSYHFREQHLEELINTLEPEYIRRARLKNIIFSFEKTSTAPSFIDEGEIRFVLQTLFDNALNYTPAEGSIVVKLEEEKELDGNVTAVVTSVTDSGIGMTHEDLGKLFEKFWRSQGASRMDTEGMGIGLYICKRIIENHKGTLWAESAGIGKGSTFKIRIPTRHGKGIEKA